jgi:hypothetical protein
MEMSEDLLDFIKVIQSILLPLKEGEFSEKLNKVSVYMSTIEKSVSMHNSTLESIRLEAGVDQEGYRKAVQGNIAANRASLANFIKFARMNLDLAMAQALDKLVRRPKSANKVDERKRMESLGKWFDQLPDPAPAMIEHFKASSNPLDKYLVAGKWGHDYLRKRHINPEAYDGQLCELIACSDSAAVRIVLSYGRLSSAIDKVEETALKMLEALEKDVFRK